MLGGRLLMGRGGHFKVRARARRRIGIVLLAFNLLAIGMAAGAAYGYLTSTGSGSGSGSASMMQTVTLVGTSAQATTSLLPGGPAGDLVVKIRNLNAFAVSVTGVATKAGGTITFDSGHSSCSTSDANPVVTVGVPPADLPLAIAANTTATFHLSGAVTMDVAATSNCQGATINVPVTITVQAP